MDLATSVLVRPAETGDFDAWLPLWRGYQEFYRVDIPEETTRETWRRVLDPAEPVHGAMALAGGEIVGIAHWIMHRSCWTIADSCYLQDLFVASGRRRGGIGRALILHVRDAAARAGCGRLYWHTHETNATARLLYDRLAQLSGFVQYRMPLG